MKGEKTYRKAICNIGDIVNTKMTFAIYLLQFVTFLDLLGIGLVVPLLPGHVRQLGGSHIHVGLLGSIYAGFQLFSGPFIGSLSDLNGRKPILMMTLLICSMAYVVLGFTSSVTVILVVRAVIGFFKHTQILARALVQEYETNEQRHAEIYGKMAAISGIGITLGPVIGGHILEDYPKYGFPFITLIVGACFVLNCGLVSFLPKSTVSIRRTRSLVSNQSVLEKITNSIKQSVLELYKINWSIYWKIFMFKAFVGFSMGVYYSNYAIYLKTIYKLTPKYVGYVISFQGTIGSVSSYFIRFINKLYKSDKDYSERNFHVFVLLTVSLTGLVFSSNVYMYMMWLIPLAVSNAVGRLVTLEMILKRSSGKHVATLIGASNSMRSLTGIISPMVSGFIGQYYGVQYVIYASLCSAFFGVLLSYQFKIKNKVH